MTALTAKQRRERVEADRVLAIIRENGRRLGPKAIECLRRMCDQDEEAVYERGRGYVGEWAFGGRVFWSLVRACAISQSGPTDGFMHSIYWRLNETGRAILGGATGGKR